MTHSSAHKNSFYIWHIHQNTRVVFTPDAFLRSQEFLYLPYQFLSALLISKSIPHPLFTVSLVTIAILLRQNLGTKKNSVLDRYLSEHIYLFTETMKIFRLRQDFVTSFRFHKFYWIFSFMIYIYRLLKFFWKLRLLQCLFFNILINTIRYL